LAIKKEYDALQLQCLRIKIRSVCSAKGKLNLGYGGERFSLQPVGKYNTGC